jgi:hypothetical protein
MIITPTVGRVVWYREPGTDQGEQPFVALVTYVWNDRLVNVAAFDHCGALKCPTSVQLLQEGDDRPTTPFCEWMPYQIGQAKKHAAD